MTGGGSERDEYARRARYLPGLLVLAPVGIVIASAGWQDARIVTVLAGLAVTVGLPIVLESFVRQQGLAFEVTELDGSDGLWTTTKMMWPSGATPAETARNAENRRVVESVLRRDLPSVAPLDEVGRAEVAAALDAAVAEVRVMTRDASTHPILRAENAEYGMWRNLRGVRTPALLVTGLAFAVAAILIVASFADRVTTSNAELVAGLFAIAALGGFWLVIPTDERIRQAAQRYALALFDAARLISSTAPRESPKVTPA